MSLIELAGCLSEDAVLSFLTGITADDDAEKTRVHLDECPLCRVLVAEAARSLSDAGDGRLPPGMVRTLAPGVVIGNRYQIIDFVARGGMGEVYRARDTTSGEIRALKTLACTALDDERATFRFQAEIRLAQKVSHPHVCGILDFGLDVPAGGIPFLTMEFLEGETLARRIARLGPPPDQPAVEILNQVLSGLEAIHHAGIVHRDLKSENIMLVAEAGRTRVVVMDFGLARATDGSVISTWPVTSVRVGTIDSMAPEQIEGKPATTAMDIFALGVVMFEMVTGRRPFVDVPPLKRLRNTAPLPSSLAPALDPRWDEVIGRCLKVRPDARYRTLNEVREALSGIGSR